MTGAESVRAAARALAGDLVLRAGAGTGKTHTLVEVFVHLCAGVSALGRRVPPARILALTFGDKAAAELRERVRARFEGLAVAPRADAALEAAYAARGMPPLGGGEWRALAGQLSSAPLGTFHAFAGAVLRRHAAAAGLDPRFEQLDEEASRRLRRAATERAVLAAIERPEVQALVAELDFSRGDDARGRGLVEHLLVVAAKLDEEGREAAGLAGEVDDAGAAEVAFTRAVAAYRAAFAELLAALGERASDAMRRRSRALEARRKQLEAWLGALGPETDPSADPVLHEVDQIVKGNLGSERRNLARGALREALAALREAHASHRAAALAAPLLELCAAAEAGYRRAKADAHALDFADLLRGARDLLAASQTAREETRARFDAVLVDEVQDTNGLQLGLLELARAPGAPLLAVGDPKQSIYAFRGADVAVFAEIGRATCAAGGQVLALTESRRARAPITDFVNRLFARALRGGAHDFEVAFDPDADALSPVRETDDSPGVTLIDSEAGGEAAAVAGWIRDLVDGARVRVYDKSGTARAPRWGDVAVLMRRFTHLDGYLRELRRAGIPHYVVGGRGFHEAQEVRDLAHALALLDHDGDALALLGVLRSPLVALSDRSIALACAGEKLSLARMRHVAAAPPEGVPAEEIARLRDYLALHARLSRHADRLGAAGLLRALVEACDLPAVLAASPSGEQRLANLELLIAQADAHDAEGRPRVGFARQLREQIDRERSLAAPAQLVGEQENVVRVMTIHQAKGLEFPVVVVPECDAGERSDYPAVAYDRAAGLGCRLRGADGQLVPSARARAAAAMQQARERAESLRLFYVATTRARDHLALAGVVGRRKECWRAQVDALLDEDETAAALCLRAQPAAAPPVPPEPSLAELNPAIDAAAPLDEADGAEEPDAEVAAMAAALAPPRTVAAVLVAPVTELSDFDACPRRYRLKHELGLEEHRSGRDSGRRAPVPAPGALLPAERLAGGAVPMDEALVALDPALDPGLRDPMARGTLAHRVLERLDLADARARGAAAIEALLALEGHVAPLSEEATEVRDAVARLVAGRFGRELAARAPESFAREHKFAFAPAGAGETRLLLKGQMDLVLFDDDAVTIVDYKLASPGDVDAYRFQLGAYAAAARALWRRPVRAGLLFLREKAPAPRLASFTDAELDDIEARLRAIAGELAQARRRGQFPGRERAQCRAIGCGYEARCHGERRTAPPPPGTPPTPARARRGSGGGGQLRLGEGIEGW